MATQATTQGGGYAPSSAPQQSSGGGFLESIMPLALIAGILGGGGKRRRGGSSGGGLLSMLMQQQAQEEAYRQKRMEQDRAYKMQLLIPMVHELARQGYAPDEALLAASKELGWDPTSMARQSFEKNRSEEVRRNAPYWTQEQAGEYLGAQTYGDMNRFYGGELGSDLARRAQAGDIVAANLMKDATAMGYANDPTAAAAFQNDPLAALASIGGMAPNADRARYGYDSALKAQGHRNQMEELGYAASLREKGGAPGGLTFDQQWKVKQQLAREATLYQEAVLGLSAQQLRPEEERKAQVSLQNNFIARVGLLDVPGLDPHKLLSIIDPTYSYDKGQGVATSSKPYTGSASDLAKNYVTQEDDLFFPTQADEAAGRGHTASKK